MHSDLNMVIKHYRELSVEELYEIMRVRVEVFVVEQNCPYQEVDGKDTDAYHVVLKDSRGIKGYLRVFRDQSCPGTAFIGRVLTTSRRQGLGTMLLREGIRIAREELGARTVAVEAQTYARQFYENVGFRQVSGEFLEDGIPHIRMELTYTEPDPK